ncbi:MAG: CoA transferase [Myxococcales bacterium]|nr:CoA transferase [Myxococcales bacterium]
MDPAPNSLRPPADQPLALQGVTVVDTTRMLPGAVLARTLLDLGARVLKIEDPAMGDPMRHMAPIVEGVGTGFAVFYRGAESVCLDLRTAAGATALRALVRRADVFVESFRPGTLARWGLGPEVLEAENPGLVRCSIPGFAPAGEADRRVGHDLNFVGQTGLLARLGGSGVPPVQLADITSGTLAGTAILAALLRRARTGRGGAITQPLIHGPMQFLQWPWIDAAAAAAAAATREADDEPSMDHSILLGGRVPCYRRYRCGDGRELTVGCLEPKFWFKLVMVLGAPEHAGAGLDVGPEGAAATARVQELLSSKSLDAWLEELAPHDLPVGPVLDLAEARRDPALASLLERTPLPEGGTLDAPGPSCPSVGRTPARPAPTLGEHTEAVLREFELDEDTIHALR